MTKEELREQWAARVAAFKARGKSVTAWCAEYQLKPHQLRYWIKKHSSKPLLKIGWYAWK